MKLSQSNPLQQFKTVFPDEHPSSTKLFRIAPFSALPVTSYEHRFVNKSRTKVINLSMSAPPPLARPLPHQTNANPYALARYYTTQVSEREEKRFPGIQQSRAKRWRFLFSLQTWTRVFVAGGKATPCFAALIPSSCSSRVYGKYACEDQLSQF